MISILPVDATAATALTELHRLAFDDPWSAQDLTALIGTPGIFALAALADGDLVGFILCRTAADEAEVLTLATAPAARRRGIASTLLDRAAVRVLSDGADALFLEVAEDNIPARALYAAQGFAQVGRRPRYYQRKDGAIAALILRRDLNRSSMEPYD